MWRLSLLLLLASGCFRPDYQCSACGAEGACPYPYQCEEISGTKVCKLAGSPTCAIANEVDAASVSGTHPPAAGELPAQVCYPGPGNCLTITPALRAGIVLWLDPTTLPAQGAAVDAWPDRSSFHNDAVPSDATTPPISTGNGVKFRMDGARIPYSASLDLGTDSFATFIVGRTYNVPGCYLARSNGLDGELERTLTVRFWPPWNPPMPPFLKPLTVLNGNVIVAQTRYQIADGLPHLVFTARVGNELRLHVDGPPAAAPVTMPDGVSIGAALPLSLGMCQPFRVAPVEGLNAVIIVRGVLDEADREALQNFLLKGFAIVP